MEIAWQDVLAHVLFLLSAAGIVLVGVLVVFLVFDVDEGATLGIGKVVVVGFALLASITFVLLLRERKTVAERLPLCTSWRALGLLLALLLAVPITSLAFIVGLLALYVLCVTMVLDESVQIAGLGICDGIVALGMAASMRTAGAWDAGGIGQVVFTVYTIKALVLPTMLVLLSMMCLPKMASFAAGSLLVFALHAAIMVVASVDMLVDQIFADRGNKLTTEDRCFRSPVGPLWRYITEIITDIFWGDEENTLPATQESVQRCMPDPSTTLPVSLVPDTAGSVAFWVLLGIGFWMAALVVSIVLFPIKRHAVHVDDGAPHQNKSMKISSAATLALETVKTAKSVKIHRNESQRKRQYVSRSPTRWLCIMSFVGLGVLLLVLLFTVARDDKPKEVALPTDGVVEPSCAGVTTDDFDFCNETCSVESACEDMCLQRCNAHCLCNLGRPRCGLYCYMDPGLIDGTGLSGVRLLASNALNPEDASDNDDEELLQRFLQDGSDTNTTTTTTTTTTFDMELCFGEVCNECEECWGIPPCDVPAASAGELVGPDEDNLIAFASVPAEYLAIAWCDLAMWSPVLIGALVYVVNAYACALVAARAYTYATQVAEQRRQNILWRDLGRQALRAEKAERKAARAQQASETGDHAAAEEDFRPESRGTAGSGGPRAPPRRQGSDLSAASQRSKTSRTSRVSSLDSSLETDVLQDRPGFLQKVMFTPLWVRKERMPAPIAVDEDGRVFKV